MHVEKPANPLPQGEYMGAEQTEFFRKLLLEKHADLSQRISDHVKGMQVQERVSDDLDKAALEYEHSVGIRLLDRLRADLAAVTAAIKRLSAGDYGYCESTGLEIGVDRLLLNPAATLCFEAMQYRELQEKHLRRYS
jgi:DnaK suppressor protein